MSDEEDDDETSPSKSACTSSDEEDDDETSQGMAFFCIFKARYKFFFEPASNSYVDVGYDVI